MEPQTVMMTMQLCETLAKKQQEDGLSKEEKLTYDKMLVTLGDYMMLASLCFRKEITSFQEGLGDSDGQLEGGVPQ